MNNEEVINIEIRNAKNQQIASIFESNLDYDFVKVTRVDHAIKILSPLEIIITVLSTTLLEKFIFDPLLNPIAEKFNWVTAVNKYLDPTKPFRLTINITDETLFIEADLETNHEFTAKIWQILNQVLSSINSHREKITKVKIICDKKGKLNIICYENSIPEFIINPDTNALVKIANKIKN